MTPRSVGKALLTGSLLLLFFFMDGELNMAEVQLAQAMGSLL